MAEDERQLGIWQFAIDHVKIRAANSARADAHEQLSPARLWLCHIAQLQPLRWLLENHRAHGLPYILDRGSMDTCRLGSHLSSPGGLFMLVVMRAAED